jgi:thiamine biosynthesis lipoprotein
LIARSPAFTVLFPLLWSLLAACAGTKPPEPRSEYVLGTFCRVDLFEWGSAAVYDRLFTRLAGLDRIFNASREDSELAALNRAAGREPVPLSPELFAVLKRALYFAEASGGAFDPTVGPLVKLWGIGTDTPRIPPEAEISAALDLVDWRDLVLAGGPDGETGLPPGRESSTGTVNPDEKAALKTVPTAFLRRPGMAVDLGAIAKGYAADELVKILREEGTPRGIIDLGGNIYAWGNREEAAENRPAAPWRIGVQDPLGERGTYMGVLEVSGSSVVSSGVYERFFIPAGDDRRYHHILDPRREIGGAPNAAAGRPVENGLLSVTVISPSSINADALSTACFVLGFEQGGALAEAQGAGTIFIYSDKTVRIGGGTEGFKLRDTAYHEKPSGDRGMERQGPASPDG